mmetsp:Transcript_2418/g.9090  ORF Transcript_2418/g.9090 Transcript_2418/m.9090 type:complete len:448 (-) Transcript_2418:151-1494(-)
MSTTADDDNIILDEEGENETTPNTQNEDIPLNLDQEDDNDVLASLQKNAQEENDEEEDDFRIEEESHDDEDDASAAKAKASRRKKNESEEEEEEIDADDQKHIFSDIFGSESDEEEEIKRQIETAGADSIISADQRALPLRRYILPEFAGPNVDSDVFFFKTPSRLQIVDKRYSEEDMIEQDSTVTHSVRWRYKTDESGELKRDDFGRPIMESNAKLIRWSDDTYQLYVGGTKADGSDTAIFEVTKSSMMEQNHHLYSTTKQSSCSFDHGKFSHKLAFRPLNVKPPLKRFRTGPQETVKRKTLLTKARKLRDTELEENKRELQELRNKMRQKRKRVEKKDTNQLDVDFLEEDTAGQSLKQIKAKYRGKAKKKKATKKSKSRPSRLAAQLGIESDDEMEDEEGENLDEYEEEEDEYEEEEYGDEGSDEDYGDDPSWNPSGRARKRQRR